MRKLFKYNQFINESKEDIDSICMKYGIENYTINRDGTVDVDGDVNLSSKNLTKLPLRFGKVTGTFTCAENELTSLQGAPYEVGGDFDCSGNELTSLEGAPYDVGDSFFCRKNNLTSLEGCPDIGGHFFDCSSNEITSLRGSPSSNITDYFCYNNQLSDVKGLNLNLTRLIIFNNPVESVFNLFKVNPREVDVKAVEIAEYLNEYDVIRDGNKVVLQALELVYDDLGLEVPENIKIEGYEII